MIVLKNLSLVIYILIVASFNGNVIAEDHSIKDTKKKISYPSIPKVEKGPVIDGELNDEAWDKAPVFELGFINKDNDELPKNKTTVKMVTDDKNLYFAFWCEEKHPNGPLLMDPSSSWAGKGRIKVDKEKENSMSDMVFVQMDFGRFGKSQLFRIHGHPGGPWPRIWYGQAGGDSLYWHLMNWRKPNVGKQLKSIFGKHKIQKGSWTFEVKISLSDILLYPKDGIPKKIGINFCRLRFGEARESLKKIVGLEDCGPMYISEKNADKYMYTWNRIRLFRGKKKDFTFWSLDPLGLGFVNLEIGNVDNKLVAKEIQGKLFQQMKRRYRHTKEEASALRMPLWEDLGDIDRNYNPTPAKVVNTLPVGGKNKKPVFSSAPEINATDGSYKISFSVSELTDVTVLIKNNKGEIIRHLCSGVLGGNAPEPFLKDSLQQTVIWDMKDDYGEKVSVGKYHIVVCLGLDVKYDKLIGFNPQASLGPITSLGTDGNGGLLVGAGFLPDRGAGGFRLIKFNREGKFKNQVVPFPRLPYEKVKGFGVVKLQGDEWVPTLYGPISKRSFYKDSFNINGSQNTPVTKDGRIVLANSDKGHWTTMKRARRQLFIINKDGSCPKGKLPVFSISRQFFTGKVSIALSPNDKYAYIVSLRRMGYGRQVYKSSPYHSILRVDLTGDGEHEGEFAEAFIGEIGKPGNDKTHLHYPESIAIDMAGNIYVADRDNHRVAIFNKDGKYIKEVKTSYPEWVAVNPKNGELYIFGRDKKDKATGYLSKYTALSELKQVTTLILPKKRGRGPNPNVLGALDVSGDRPLIWIKDTRVIGFKKLPATITDMGTTLKITEKPFHAFVKNKKVSGVGMNLDGTELLHIDRRNEELYVQGHQIWDGHSGKYLREFMVKGWKAKSVPELVVDRNTGNVFAAWQTQVGRYTPDGMDAPFKSGISHLPQTLRGHSCPNRGHDINRKGDIFVMHHYDAHGNNAGCVSRYGSDGKVKDYEFINIPVVSAGVKVDSKGFIYVGSGVRTEDYPKVFDNLVKSKALGDPRATYRQSYGGIMKFRPDGGEVVFDKNGPLVAGAHYRNNTDKAKSVGAIWIHSGMSPMIRKSGLTRCSCEIPRFDLDDSDRVFYPDVHRRRVGVLDSNGNTIINIGGHGNMNDQGPDIRFGWPLAVAVSDNAIYVSDTINCRLMRLKIGYKEIKSHTIEVK